ncbi:MAG: serine/threonine-protein kinase [Polyangiales bacterium]
MAATYLAEGPAPGKRVVLKLLPWTRFRGASAEAARALFEGEMERLTRVVHPNVVGIVDAGFVDEGAFIALEYIPGASLETLLNMLEKVEARVLGPIISDVASALAWLHRKGVLHRDVKPANLLAQLELPEGVELKAETFPHAELVRAVLIDFGIATEVARAGAHEGVTGTPGYIAPEVARGVEPFGPAVDVYSLAVVCFEMLTGTNPFLEGRPDLQTVLVRHGSMALPWSRVPAVAHRAELIALLSDATRFDPRQRISMREFLSRWKALSAKW